MVNDCNRHSSDGETAMRRMAMIGLAAVLVLCVGCTTDQYARHVVEYNTATGKGDLALMGAGEALVKNKMIDAHRQVATPDQTVIDVWVLKARPPAGAAVRGTALILHDFGESKARYRLAGQNLAKMGYDVVLMDLRAHGRSTGKYVTYGGLEKDDVKAVMDALTGDGTVNPNVYAFGVTLGAMTAIQYAAIDPRCKGVVAFRPYKDAATAARNRMGLSAPAMSPKDFEEVLGRAGDLAHFNPHLTSCELAAMRLSCPLLLIHPMFDLFVPVSNSEAILAAVKGPKKLELVTPIAEEVVLAARLNAWIAEKIDYVATTGLVPPPATAPASQPEPAAPASTPAAAPSASPAPAPAAAPASTPPDAPARLPILPPGPILKP